MIPYGRQHITDEDLKAVADTLKSDFLTQGPKVLQFEKKFAEYVEAPHAIAVNNATAALHLCCLALGVKKGHKILCTPNTFVASSNAVLYCGADVEFIDIDPETFCIDYRSLKSKLAGSAKGSFQGIIAVDFGGYPLDFQKLKEIVSPYGLWIIEDACHAPGAEYQTESGRWEKTGNGKYADLATFSFHPVKHIATGEGGMITTASAALAKKINLLRTHGITKDPQEMSECEGGWDMEMIDLGYNYRMPDILCALGLSQLNRMEANLNRRREIAERYNFEFKDLPFKTPSLPKDIRHAFHLYVIQTEKRKELYDFLKLKQIYAQVHYIPIYQQPFYEKKYGKQSFAKADNYYRKALSLPMYHSMTVEDQSKVIEAVREFFSR